MRYAIISDIHSNLQAMEAVFMDIGVQKVDSIICLGDLVGYGPQPAETLSLVHSHVHTVLMGNHDAAVAGLLDAECFNDDAKMMIEWTKSKLNSMALEYLSVLPASFANEDLACTHGDYNAPGYIGYISDENEALEAFSSRPEMILFAGHTHQPGSFVLESDGSCRRLPEGDISIEPGCRYLVNPGSVGIPRDDDFRASYCIYDSSSLKVQFHRILYDVERFKKELAKEASASEQAAYLLSIYESHKLPALYKEVDFKRNDARPARRFTVARRTTARPEAAKSRVSGMTPQKPQAKSKNRTAVIILAASCTAVLLASAILILLHGSKDASKEIIPSVLPSPEIQPAPETATREIKNPPPADNKAVSSRKEETVSVGQSAHPVVSAAPENPPIEKPVSPPEPLKKPPVPATSNTAQFASITFYGANKDKKIRMISSSTGAIAEEGTFLTQEKKLFATLKLKQEVVFGEWRKMEAEIMSDCSRMGFFGISASKAPGPEYTVLFDDLSFSDGIIFKNSILNDGDFELGTKSSWLHMADQGRSRYETAPGKAHGGRICAALSSNGQGAYHVIDRIENKKIKVTLWFKGDK